MIYPETAWYCLKVKTKKESIAAAIVRNRFDIEVFSPSISFMRKTIRGPKLFTEALFPGYLLAKFNPTQLERQVIHSQDVHGLVRFGNHVPTLPEETIGFLKSHFNHSSKEAINPPLSEGDTVELVEGCLKGVTGVIENLDIKNGRVGLLIEFLGNQNRIKVSTCSVFKPQSKTMFVPALLRAGTAQMK